MSKVIGFTKLETLMRKAASLDIKKSHAQAITDIAEAKLLDMLIAAERDASQNGRDVIMPGDLPVTKGLQETMIAFKKLEETIEVRDVLDYLATVPPLRYPLSSDTETMLPEIYGSLLVVFGRIAKLIDANDRALDSKTIEKTKEIMDLTL